MAKQRRVSKLVDEARKVCDYPLCIVCGALCVAVVLLCLFVLWFLNLSVCSLRASIEFLLLLTSSASLGYHQSYD